MKGIYELFLADLEKKEKKKRKRKKREKKKWDCCSSKHVDKMSTRRKEGFPVSTGINVYKLTRKGYAEKCVIFSEEWGSGTAV